MSRLLNRSPESTDAPAKPDPEANPLLAFTAESSRTEHAASTVPGVAVLERPAVAARLLVPRPLAVGLGATLVLAVVGAIALVRAGWLPLSAAAPPLAKVTIQTKPAGADILVDGQRRGVSPLAISLAAGAHNVTVHQGSEVRSIPLNLSAGSEVTHYIEFNTLNPSTSLGTIAVATDPPGAKVSVDGQPRGVSPIRISDLAVAAHKVSVTSETGSAERSVAVEAGTTTSVVFALPKVASPLAGWITVSVPFDVQVDEGDAVIGTGKAAKIMLAAGRHEISLSSESLGYQDKRTVEVAAGKTTTIKIDAPKRPLNVNARPWADVTIDGTSAGQTPISNLPMTIGSHQIVFRHPQFGERRETVVVTMQGPNRVSVDMTK